MVGERNKSLLEALKDYLKEDILPLHTPGHKQGRWVSPEMGDALGQALALDLTEVDGLDDLAAPAGVIREAQERAARVFGARASFFLVNGSTGGIHASFLALSRMAGKKVVISRYSHRAAYAALILSGLEPVFIPPAWSKEGVALGFDPGQAAKALASRDSRPCGIFLTTPSYFGVCPPLVEIIANARRLEVPVIVDEAHGPHFIFSPKLPPTALEQGAGVAIQSAHKFLPALTQASLLHVGESFPGLQEIEGSLRLVHSSSPSYLLMASLDEACRLLDEKGPSVYGDFMDRVELLRDELAAIKGISLLTEANLSEGYFLDHAKIALDFTGLGLTGWEAAAFLRERFKIQAEMADSRRVLFILTPGEGDAGMRRLEEAVRGLASSFPAFLTGCSKLPNALLSPPPLGCRIEALPREAWMGSKAEIPLGEAAGKVSSDFITLSPPGVPLLFPGQLIEEETVEYLRALLGLAGQIKGFEPPCGENIKVML